MLNKYICVSRFCNRNGIQCLGPFQYSVTLADHISHCRLSSPSASEWCILWVSLRKSGARITQIYASEDKLYLGCFEEHRHAEWVTLSMNTSLMKEMSDCNLARRWHSHHTHTPTHRHSSLPIPIQRHWQMEASLSRQKFSDLEKATPPQFNEGEPQQWCSNDWIVYSIIPPPPGQSLCVHRRPSFSHHRAREGRENKRASPMLTQ